MPADNSRSRDREREREREPVSPPNKRNSITGRLVNSWNTTRAQASASIQRRTSSAGANGNSALPNKTPPVGRIREWLDTCNREHDHHCNVGSSDPKDDATWRPLRLIDATERILVLSQPKDRYLALSYVHGTRGDGITLTTDKIEEWEDDGLPEDELPQTMLDSIWLARKLGIRYIWVAPLCIVQDDATELENHTRHMAFVFANAYITLVAAHGDMWTGLVPLSPKRSQTPPVKNSRSGSRDHDDLLLDTKWIHRGWTMQEYIYSRRCVFFFEETMTWECHCELWQGSPAAVAKAIRGSNRITCTGPIPSDAAFAFRHSPWPDMDEFARICMDYSGRRISTVDDTLRAMSGITHVLSRIFPGGFLYGMPLMFLDVALLWRPQASIRRRAVTKPPFLPSWSWMGWWFDSIPVDLVLWRAAADYVQETSRPSAKRGQSAKRLGAPHGFKIKPTITWSLTDMHSTAPIENTGFQFRDMRSRRSAPSSLPPGWSRSGSGFKHDSDDITTFKHPIPVEDPPEQGDYEPPTGEAAFPGPYLSFSTQSAFFEVDFSTAISPRDTASPPVAEGNIWAKSSRWAGTVRAHDGWLGVQSSNYDGDEKLEFIAISTATERRGSHVFSEEQFNANKDADEFVEIVNVLWVEKIGRMWFRRGLGHVLSKAWEAQPKNEVNILLG